MHTKIGMSPQEFKISSFLSIEKDIDLILRKLFILSKPYSDTLKRLLIINAPDCLDNTTSTVYKNAIDMSLSELKEKGYIRFVPKLTMEQHEDVQNYIDISVDNFFTTMTNPQFRDCTISFNIICHTDNWDLGDFRFRPLKIAGYIDGILNNTKLTGIGTFQFAGCKQLVLDENFAGYTLVYSAVHGSDDILP